MYTLNCRGKMLVMDKPLVMGIINTTPDSFFKDSRKQHLQEVIDKAGEMLEQGAAILDVGGQSTRPGASLVCQTAETERVLPAIEAICSHFPGAIVSVDTFYAAVAQAAVNAGAVIVNDVSAGLFDAAMLGTVAALGVPYVCMHHRGIPVAKGQEFHYDNLAREVLDFFIERNAACSKAGIKDMVIDPGFGFGKNIAQNLQLLKQLPVLKMPGRPLLLGISRKSTVWKTLGVTAGEALNGSTVLHTIGLLNGAGILRVHDVREAVEAVKLVEAYLAD